MAKVRQTKQWFDHLPTSCECWWEKATPVLERRLQIQCVATVWRQRLIFLSRRPRLFSMLFLWRWYVFHTPWIRVENIYVVDIHVATNTTAQ